MDCSRITKGFVGGSCDSIPQGGTGTKVWIFNYADIDRSASTTTSETLSLLKLVTGKQGYVYQSLDNSTDGSATLNKQTYVSNYDHQVNLRIFNDEQEAKEFLNEAKEARIVCIVERRTTGDNKFEVYGWQSGLKMSENPYSTKFTDNVAYAPVFKSDDDSKETNLPLTCTMTESALDALCQAPAVA